MRLPLSMIVLAFCAAAGPATAPATRPALRKLDAAVPAEFVEHRLSRSEATIKAPPKWHEGVPRGNVLINLVADDGSRANVNVVMIGPTGNADPQADAEGMLKVVATHIDNFARVSSEVVDVGGAAVARVVYEGDVGGKRLRWEQAMVPTPARAYVITYAAGLDHFAKHEREVEQMLASFKTGE